MPVCPAFSAAYHQFTFPPLQQVLMPPTRFPASLHFLTQQVAPTNADGIWLENAPSLGPGSLRGEDLESFEKWKVDRASARRSRSSELSSSRSHSETQGQGLEEDLSDAQRLSHPPSRTSSLQLRNLFTAPATGRVPALCQSFGRTQLPEQHSARLTYVSGMCWTLAS